MSVYVVDAEKLETNPELRWERESKREGQTKTKTRTSRTPARKRSPGALEGKFKPKTLGYEET